MASCGNLLTLLISQKTACAAVHAYANRCQLVGAKIDLPDECVECTSVDRSLYDASESRDSTISAMDLVIVMEQGSCMRWENVLLKRKEFAV